MKKNYIEPQTEIIEVKIDSLLTNVSNTEAASDAEALSREDAGWEDE